MNIYPLRKQTGIFRENVKDVGENCLASHLRYKEEKLNFRKFLLVGISPIKSRNSHTLVDFSCQLSSSALLLDSEESWRLEI